MRISALILVFILFGSLALVRGQAGGSTPTTFTVPVLPHPTGPMRIGASVFHLTNTSIPDRLAPGPGKFRELMVQIWYPADPRAKGTPAPYLPDPALVQALKDEQHDGQEPALFDSWLKISTAAIFDAQLAVKPARFPILFFSHGLGESRSSYTAIVQDLVSHGYLIVCIDHPYGGITVLPDGRVLNTAGDPDTGNPEGSARQVDEWAADAGYVLGRLSSSSRTDPVFSRFLGRIDLGKVGMLGHSLGGAAALEACLNDDRFRACADLDGAPFGKVVEAGVRRPTLIMRSGPIYSDADLAKRGRTRAQWDEMGRQGKVMWDSLVQRRKGVPVYLIKINGAGHMTYSDAPFVMPDTIARFGGRIIGGQRAFQIMTVYIRDFFDKFLNGQSGGILERTGEIYPEVSSEKYLP